MKKFIVTYHATESALTQMENTSPEDAKKGMELWMKWADKCGDNLIDLGSPLTSGLKLMTKGDSQQSNRQVCGYSILQAENMDHAKELLNGHPHLGWDMTCEIEIHESMPLPA